MNKGILIIGGFIEIIELCEENGIDIIGIVDKCQTSNFPLIPLIGDDDNLDLWKNKFIKHKLVITPDLPEIRMKLYGRYKACGFEMANIISKLARVSKSAIIGEGTVIQAGVNISSLANLGKLVKINNNANLMHNVEVGDFTTIAPNAVLLGHVKVGQLCYVGANATLLPGISLCNGVTIGAGAVVTKSIYEPHSVYAGIPARRIN